MPPPKPISTAAQVDRELIPSLEDLCALTRSLHDHAIATRDLKDQAKPVLGDGRDHFSRLCQFVDLAGVVRRQIAMHFHAVEGDQ